MGKFSIYFLAHPDLPNVPKYIGSTSKPLAYRLAIHVCDSMRVRTRKDPVWIWLNSIVISGKCPIIVLLDFTEDEKSIKELEKVWISRYAHTDILNMQHNPFKIQKPRGVLPSHKKFLAHAA